MDDKDSEQRGRAIVQSLAVVVQSMLQPIDAANTAYVARSKFEAFRAPNISIQDYLMRINKYASCSPECFVLALVYIDRLHNMHGLTLTELNVHRVLITSVVLAAKFFDDHYFNNAYYSKVGGVPCSEMNELEVEFLLLTNFSLHVSTDVYVRYYNELTSTYVFNSLRSGTPIHQFRPYVAMNPEQDGQLIYVAEGEIEGLPLPTCEEEMQQQEQMQQQSEQQQYQEQYEQQYEQQAYGQQRPQHYEQQQQVAPAPEPVNPYQQSVQEPPRANPFGHSHHVVSSQQPVDALRPTYAHQQPQQPNPYHYAPPVPVHGYPQHVNEFASTKHAVSAHPHAQFQQSHHHHQYNHTASNLPHTQRSSMVDGAETYYSASTVPAGVNGKYVAGLPPAPAASSSNGIVYASAGRTSGQKRRKSIALGVNA